MRLLAYFVLALGSTAAVTDVHSADVSPVFAGTWNVTATLTEDITCAKATPGDVSAYVWIVSQAAGGDIAVTVQGETSFPKLSGKWNADRNALFLSSSASGAFSRGAVWFKLMLNSKGELTGIRRSVADSGGANGSPCFADFQIVAKKQ